MGQRTLYVTDNPGPDHPIAQDIGYEPLLQLVALYGGQTIRPPVMNKSHIRQRLQCLLMLKHGMSYRQVAWVLNTTMRKVKRLVGECEGSADERGNKEAA